MTNDVASSSKFFWNLSLFFQLLGGASATFIPLYWLSLDYSKASVAEFDSIGFFLSLVGPILAGFIIGRVSFKLFVAITFVMSGFFSILIVLGESFFLKFTGFTFILLGLSITSTLVPLSVIVMLQGSSFGLEYGTYRRIGSYGFILGLLLAGVFADIYGPGIYPIIAGLGFILSGLCFYIAPIPSRFGLFLKNFSIKKLFVSWDLLFFGFAQIIIWASLCVSLRYLPIRMDQMGSSSLIISITISCFGLFAILSLRFIGFLADRVSSRLLWGVIPFFLSLRILLLYFPEENFFWFIPMQVLHIPTWVLYDVLTVYYLKEKREELGAVPISVLTQIGMFLGFSIGSFLMSISLPVFGLKDSFLILSIFPIIFCPIFMMKWTKLSQN